MELKVINRSGHDLPKYETEHAAGLDLKAFVTAPVELEPMQRKLVGTGLYIELPIGYEAQIRPRSGLAYKYGITVLNSPGTVDADYRGEIKVLLINLSGETFKIENGERIAQMIVAPHATISLTQVDVLSDTSRGAGGYGSTGRN